MKILYSMPFIVLIHPLQNRFQLLHLYFYIVKITTYKTHLSFDQKKYLVFTLGLEQKSLFYSVTRKRLSTKSTST